MLRFIVMLSLLAMIAQSGVANHAGSEQPWYSQPCDYSANVDICRGKFIDWELVDGPGREYKDCSAHELAYDRASSGMDYATMTGNHLCEIRARTEDDDDEANNDRHPTASTTRGDDDDGQVTN